MKPKEKAKELVDKMYQHQWRKDTIEFRNAKQCAIIAVDEILEIVPKNNGWQTSLEYWQQVKQEIEKL